MAELTTPLTTPLMTRYEMGRLAEIKAQGVPHEDAKSRVYAERGPSGEPRTGPAGPASAPGQLAKVAPPGVAAPLVVVAPSGLSPWWGILAILAVVIYFGSRKTVVVEAVESVEPAEDLGDLPTGMITRPKRKR